MNQRTLFSACLLLLAACSSPDARTSDPAPIPTPDEVAVLNAVQRTFDGLAAHDSLVLAEVVLPQANFQRWAADTTGIWRTVNMTGESFTSRLGQPGPAYLERTWEESVRIEGNVAVFSAPYDFWVEQSCSHCGIDAITLLRSAPQDSAFRGWRIASLTYTVDARGETDCRARFSGMPATPFPAAEE